MVVRCFVNVSLVTVAYLFSQACLVLTAKSHLRSKTVSLELEENVESSAHLTTCPAWRDPAAASLRTHAEFLLKIPKRRGKENPVTLVTQGTLDRLESFKQILHRWKGPISVVFYAKPNNISNACEECELFRKWAHDKRKKFGPGSSVKLIVDGNSTRPYPINVLRNIAVAGVHTPFVFPLDMDFVPSLDLYHEIVSHLPRVKEALVVPAFNVHDGNDHLPTPANKQQLRKRMPRSFRAKKAPRAHKATRPLKWLATKRRKYAIRVDPNTHEGYEPYVVVRRRFLPRYDERFMGYGKNKVQWVLCLRCIGYRFSVLGRAFVTHVEHETPSFRSGGLQVEQQKRSDADMANFVKELKCPRNKSPLKRKRIYS